MTFEGHDKEVSVFFLKIIIDIAESKWYLAETMRCLFKSDALSLEKIGLLLNSPHVCLHTNTT